MALSVQKFREIVFQLLYSRSFDGVGDELSLLIRQNTVAKSIAKKAQVKVDAIWEKKTEIEILIAKYATDYDVGRIARIEKAILQLGLYELCYSDLPEKVAIGEAIRITRKYSTAEGASFVNALMDAVYKNEELSNRRALGEIHHV